MDPDLRELGARLSRVGASATALGLAVGSGGNLSARLPGDDRVMVTATGTWLDRLDDDCFSVVSLASGEVLDGASHPTSELPLHLATYQRRPDVNAIVHLHPQVSVLLTTLGHSIELSSTDHAYYVRRIAVVPFLPPGTTELAEAAAAAAADCDCILLTRHGCSVLGDTIETAHKRALNLEEAARATYAALLLRATLPPLPDGVWDWVARVSRSGAP